MIQALVAGGEPTDGVSTITTAIDAVGQLALRVADPWRVLKVNMQAATAGSIGTGWRRALGCSDPPPECDLVLNEVDIKHVDSGGLSGGDADQAAWPSPP